MNDILKYEVKDRIARITLNRPSKRNALSFDLLSLLHDALWESDEDRTVHAVILRGAGPCFSAGYDLTNFGGIKKKTAFGTYRGMRRFDDDAWHLERAQRLRMAIFDMHKPVIAQVHGHCLAGGTDIALLCDMVLVSKDAVLGFPPARDLGALPNHMWLYLIGPQWAKRLTLTGDTITGEEAAQIGLVMKAVAIEHLEGEVEGLAKRLGEIDQDLLSANKRVVNLGLELMGARTLQRLAAENDARGHQAESAENFRRTMKESGLKKALLERDQKFGDGRAKVVGPELRDEKGVLKDRDS